MSIPNESPESRRPMTSDEVARLAEPIARITSLGLPLASGLRAAAMELPAGRVRHELGVLAGRLEAGDSLDDAMASLGTRVPEHLRGLLRVGARTGRLGETLSRFLGFVNVGEEIRRRLVISLLYPIVAFLLSIGVFVFVCVTLVTSFDAIFMDFGIPLPAITVVLVSISRVFQRTWSVFVEAIVLMFVVWVLLRFFVSARVRRSLVSSLPIIGKVWRNTSLAEYCHLLALMIEANLPLGESLRMAGNGVADATLARAGRRLEEDVEAGLSLSQAVLRQPVFPRGLARLLRWAEGHQSLAESLRMAGQMFEARARSQAGFAGTVLTTLAVIFILFGVSVVVGAVLIPMITLISRLSG